MEQYNSPMKNGRTEVDMGWDPAAEIDPDIAAAWDLSRAETELLGTLVVADCTLCEAAQLLGKRPHTLENQSADLQEKLRRSSVVGPGCDRIDLVVGAYLAQESRMREERKL
jgi:hypothetical protein